MWIVAGLFFLGLLVGNLVGLTSESVVTSLVWLLFALIDGSVVALLGKLTPQQQRLVSTCHGRVRGRWRRSIKA